MRTSLSSGGKIKRVWSGCVCTKERREVSPRVEQCQGGRESETSVSLRELLIAVPVARTMICIRE